MPRRVEPTNEVEKAIDIATREATCGFVEHEDATFEGDCSGDFHHLLLGERQAANFGLRPDVADANLCERGRRPPSHLGPTHKRSRRRLDAKQNVLHHRKMRCERQLLIDHRDALPAGVERLARPIGLAIEPHLAFVGLMGARKHFHQRALPRTVFANECENFAGREPSRPRFHVACGRRPRGSEPLRHAEHFQARSRHHSSPTNLRISGSFSMRSAVTSSTPVSIRGSTFSPRRCFTNVSTAR